MVLQLMVRTDNGGLVIHGEPDSGLGHQLRRDVELREHNRVKHRGQTHTHGYTYSA